MVRTRSAHGNSSPDYSSGNKRRTPTSLQRASSQPARTDGEELLTDRERLVVACHDLRPDLAGLGEDRALVDPGQRRRRAAPTAHRRSPSRRRVVVEPSTSWRSASFSGVNRSAVEVEQHEVGAAADLDPAERRRGRRRRPAPPGVAIRPRLAGAEPVLVVDLPELVQQRRPSSARRTCRCRRWSTSRRCRARR